MQRKRYKTHIGKLNSISEEDCNDKNIKLIPDHKKGGEDKTNMDERKLSEEEVLKALEGLNKLEVPNDIPVLHESDKPKFYRSNTVQEPEIVKKQTSQLFKHILVDAPNLFNIDNNNPDKANVSSSLEIKLKPAVDSEEGKDLLKLTNDESLSGGMSEDIIKKFFEDSDVNISNIHQNVNNDVRREYCPSQISQSCDYKNTDTKPLSHDENLIKISSSNTSEKNKIMQLHPHVAEIKANEVKTIEDKKFPHYSEDKIDKCKEVSEEYSKIDLSVSDNQLVNTTSYDDDDNEDTKDGKKSYERPLSMDSNDSAVTVIYKEAPNTNKNNLEDNSMSGTTFQTESKPNEALSEHEHLINDFQNKLLDQISGKNGSIEETIDKFDIDQLRKELEEAGLIYNTDDNHIRHENSTEILDDHDHDQLLDYLEDFESLEGSESSHLKDLNFNLPSRDLPDIKEEDFENKITNPQRIKRALSPEKMQEDTQAKGQQDIVPNSIRVNKNMPENDLNIEKIKSTLKECEDIAREINIGFKAIKDDGIMKHEPKNPLQKEIPTSRQPEQLFCGTTEGLNEHEVIPKDVEIITPINSKEENTLKIILNDDQNKCVEGSSNQNIDEKSKSTPTKGLLHTGELHDSIVAPFPKESNSKSENKGVELSTKNISEVQTSKLLHTGELHDTVVVPLPLKARNILENDRGKQFNDTTLSAAREVPLSSSISHPNIEVQDVKDDGSRLGMHGLLHTGELHDTLVTPLLIKAQNSLAENNDKRTKISESDLTESAQKHLLPELNLKRDSDQLTRLLHTGELHDPVILPLPRDVPDASTEDRGPANLEDNKLGAGGPENVPRQVDSESQTTGDPSIAVQLSEVPGRVFIIIVSGFH